MVFFFCWVEILAYFGLLITSAIIMTTNVNLLHIMFHAGKRNHENKNHQIFLYVLH
jgi:hypothetical protein